MTVLISGLLPYESGKTYFAVSLARGIKSLGLSVIAFKPVAAHSIWYQYKVFAESIRLGILVGEDVLNYMRLGLIANPDVQNPIDILTAVPDVSKYSSVDEYLRVLEDVTSQALLIRISYGGLRRYLLVREVFEKLNDYLRNEIKNALNVFSPVSQVSRLWLINYLMSKEVDNVILNSFSGIKDSADVVIIESFSNALIPSTSLAPYVNTLIIVTPGKALIFSGMKLRSYISAIRSLADLESRRFMKIFRPDAEVTIPLSEEWPPKKLGHDVVSYILELK